MSSKHLNVYNMNYQKIYDGLISNCKLRDGVDGYNEVHHIIPKSMGGHKTDDANLVALTAREHFIAHFLLAKIYGGSQWHAIRRMRGNDGFYVNSRLYEVARREIAKDVSKRMAGVPKSDEQRAKISASSIGKKKSPEAVEKTRQALIGRKATPEQIACLALGRVRPDGYVSPLRGKKKDTPWMFGREPANKGKTASNEAKAKMSAAGKGRKQTPEQIAKRVASRRATLAAQGRLSGCLNFSTLLACLT